MEICNYCNGEFPAYRELCPHCGRHVGFPNVRHSKRSEEELALNGRYEVAMQDAQMRGCESEVRNFEKLVGSNSKAILNRTAEETIRLATDGVELYANYYQLTESEIRLPLGAEWDFWRRTAEEAVLPGYKEKINFAALSLTSAGLPNYGQCSWVCKTAQIAHRTTVFEQNCVTFMWPINIKDAAHLPVGYRASWEARGKLAVAKVAGKIQPNTMPDVFPALLLAPNTSIEKDEFIEVHIYGTLSIHSLEKISLRNTDLPCKSEIGALKHKLSAIGVPLEIVQCRL
ncbi:MAG: hypothetical protein ABSD77_06555 [Verrucomicrobiota bacterium]|jgi:hypothetical protein